MQPIPIRVHGKHRKQRHRHRAHHSPGHHLFRRALIWAAVITAISVLMMLVMARPASAATVATVQTPGPDPAAIPNPPAVDDLPTVIANARNWFVGILSAVMLFFFTLGAVRYIAGGSDPSETERAKGLMKNSILGYALGMMASVVLTIVQQIIGVK